MAEMVDVAERYGENVFSDAVMRERLPKQVYRELQETIQEGKDLDTMTAAVVAQEMKNWALEKGATH